MKMDFPLTPDDITYRARFAVYFPPLSILKEQLLCNVALLLFNDTQDYSHILTERICIISDHVQSVLKITWYLA